MRYLNLRIQGSSIKPIKTRTSASWSASKTSTASMLSSTQRLTFRLKFCSHLTSRPWESFIVDLSTHLMMECSCRNNGILAVVNRLLNFSNLKMESMCLKLSTRERWQCSKSSPSHTLSICAGHSIKNVQQQFVKHLGLSSSTSKRAATSLSTSTLFWWKTWT